MIEIRFANHADVERVSRIWYVGWHEVHDGNVPDALVDVRTRESFARRSADRVSDTVVAVVDGAVAGFVMVNDDEVDQVYVAGNNRGTGIAAAVLTAGERRIAEQGYPTAWLAVVPRNARARRFYERQGWQDGGLFEHTAPGPTGPIAVVCHRYIRYLRQ